MGVLGGHEEHMVEIWDQIGSCESWKRSSEMGEMSGSLLGEVGDVGEVGELGEVGEEGGGGSVEVVSLGDAGEMW